MRCRTLVPDKRPFVGVAAYFTATVGESAVEGQTVQVGFMVSCPKHGPDVLIEHAGRSSVSSWQPAATRTSRNAGIDSLLQRAELTRQHFLMVARRTKLIQRIRIQRGRPTQNGHMETLMPGLGLVCCVSAGAKMDLP
jgi:hypothetical protein